MAKTIKEKNETEKNEKKELNLFSMDELFDLFRNAEKAEDVTKSISNHILKIQEKHELSDYHLVFLYDEHLSISTWHSNRIYEALNTAKSEKDIFLFLHSGGGAIEPAYLISKTCKRLSNDKFIVTVPRRAKSAATLISLGADEIHMGLMSELGPIDPQIAGYPALGLSNALESLAKLSKKYPESSNMFSLYLTHTLSLRDLGYFERISESAVQYAERLLRNKNFPSGQTPQSLANHFVNHYKDHGFVIDFDEATSLLGENIIKRETKEYIFANEVYQFLDFLKFLFSVRFQKKMSYVGNNGAGFYLAEEKEK